MFFYMYTNIAPNILHVYWNSKLPIYTCIQGPSMNVYNIYRFSDGILNPFMCIFSICLLYLISSLQNSSVNICGSYIYWYISLSHPIIIYIMQYNAQEDSSSARANDILTTSYVMYWKYDYQLILQDTA